MAVRPLTRSVQVLAVLGILAVAGMLIACGQIRAGLLLRDILKPVDTYAGEVTETLHTVPARGQDLRVRLYRPKDEEDPLPAFVLVHGAIERGADEPRLIALARALAVRGATVATPDLPSLMSFRMDGEDPARIATVGRWLAEREDLSQDGRVALLGISIGGSYCIVAAANPELRDHLTTTIAFGAYADLTDLLVQWMVRPEAASPGLHDPLTYGRQLVLLGNLDPLVPPENRDRTRLALRQIIDEQSIAEGDYGAEGALVLRIAESREPVAVEDVDRLLAPVAPALARLSPTRTEAVPQVPLFLLHGQEDPLVPAAQAVALEAWLTERGVEVELLLTDLFSHVNLEGAGSPGLFKAWPLLTFLADALDAAGL